MVMVIGGIMALVMTCQFVAEYRFRTALKNQANVLEDAQLAMNHLARVLRFAKPATVAVTNDSNYSTIVNANIEGGHLSAMPSLTHVVYRRAIATDSIEYISGSGNPAVIARNVTGFTCSWDLSKNEFTITLTTGTGGKKSSLETKILALGA